MTAIYLYFSCNNYRQFMNVVTNDKMEMFYFILLCVVIEVIMFYLIALCTN